jgi:hypothetical protein
MYPVTLDIKGIADFETDDDLPVVIKIKTNTDTDQLIGFNRAIGVNRENDEADNDVAIIETNTNGEGYSQSWLRQHLIQGEIYKDLGTKLISLFKRLRGSKLISD